MPVARADDFFTVLSEMLDSFRLRSGIEPIYLGGGEGGDGGAGGPPGGFIGQIPQRDVAYDTTEAERFTFTSGSTSLVDNLNRLRARANTTVRLLNQTGSQVTDGDVVVIYTGSNESFDNSVTLNDPNVLGVVRETISSGSLGFVSLVGYVPRIKVTSQVNRGDFLFHSTTTRKVYGSTFDFTSGVVGRALSSGSTEVSAVIFARGGGTVYGSGLADRVGIWKTSADLSYDDGLRWDPVNNFLKVLGGRVGIGNSDFTPSEGDIHIRSTSASITLESLVNAGGLTLRRGGDQKYQYWVYEPVSVAGYSHFYGESKVGDYMRLYEEGWLNLNPNGYEEAKVGIGDVIPFANLDLEQPVYTSGSALMVRFTAGAHTAMVAGVEAVDIMFNLSRPVTFASGGTLTDQRAFKIMGPTYQTAGSTTIHDASTLYVQEPSLSAISGFGRKWAAKFDGRIHVKNRGLFGDITSGSLFHSDIIGNVHIIGNTTDIYPIVVDNYYTDDLYTPGSYPALQGAITFRRAQGGISSPQAITSGSVIGRIGFQGRTSGGNYPDAAGFVVRAEYVNSGALIVAGRMEWWTSGSGSTTLFERMRLTSEGQLGIGIAPETPYAKVHAKMSLSGFWVGEVANITSETIVILPVGSVVYGLRCNYSARKAGTGITTLAGISVAISAETTLITNGGGTFVLRVNADGSVDIRRTAGTDTLTVCQMAINYI